MSLEPHGSPYQRRHTLVAGGRDEQAEDNSSTRTGNSVREGNSANSASSSSKYTHAPRTNNDGDEEVRVEHDTEGLPAFRRKASHSAPSIRTKEGTNQSSLYSTRDDGTMLEPSQFIGIAGNDFGEGMGLELAGRGGVGGGGGGFAAAGYDSVLSNGEPLGGRGRGGVFSSSYKRDDPSFYSEDQQLSTVPSLLSGGGGRGAAHQSVEKTTDQAEQGSSMASPASVATMPMAGVPPLSRPAQSPPNPAGSASTRKGTDVSSSPLSHSRDVHVRGKGKAKLGGGSTTSSVEGGHSSSPKRSGSNEKNKSSSPLRSSSQFVSSSFASNAMGATGSSSSPTAGGQLRRRTRDAWDKRIRDQMWLFDSHNPSHPRNDPSAPQEDTVDSFEYGPDVLGTGAGALGGGIASSPHGVRVGKTTISADGVPISAIPVEGRSRVAGSTIVDTSSQGGAVMVVGETGRSADAGTQSMFGSTADACVATVITTADLASLIPFHDDALMLRATLPSLQRLERHALKLLGHVRREIESQIQNAGVSYRRHHLDGNTNTSGIVGINQVWGEGEGEHHKSRKGRLGSRSIADLRRGLAEKALLMSAVSGVGGATAGGGASQLVTSVTVDGRGRTSINTGAPFSNRSELMYSGGLGVGGALGRPRDVFDPLLMSNAPSLGGVTNVGLVGSSSLVHGNAAGGSGGTSKLPFTGVSGYSLYDEQAKSSAVSLLTLGEEMTRRHHTFDNINHSVEYYSPLAVLGDARGHQGQGQGGGGVSPSLPHTEHPTGGYTYTTIDGVTLGQWSRELDVATKGMGLQGFSEAQAKQLKEELERREVLRRALESINTKKQPAASSSLHDVSSSFGSRGGAGLRSEEIRGGQRASYAADPHRSALSNTYNQNTNLGVGAGSGWSFSDASSSARREGYLPSATAATTTAGIAGISHNSSNNNLINNWYNGSSLLVSPTTTDASNQKSFSLAAPSTPAGTMVSFSDRATRYVGR